MQLKQSLKAIYWAFGLVLLGDFCPQCLIAGELIPEYQIKVAYLYQFTRFVEWPAFTWSSPTTSFRICMLGSDGLSNYMPQLNAHVVGKRNVTLDYPRNVANASQCQILYIATSDSISLPKIIRDLKNKPILTVSSMPDFINHDGMIEFVVINRKVRLSVNYAAVHLASLEMSAKLLEVCVRVIGQPQSGKVP